MQTYSLTDVRNKHGEVFDHASHDPVLLTRQERPSYVLLSFRCYQQLMERMARLEDEALGQLAHKAYENSDLVGSDAFKEALEVMAYAKA